MRSTPPRDITSCCKDDGRYVVHLRKAVLVSSLLDGCDQLNLMLYFIILARDITSCHKVDGMYVAAYSLLAQFRFLCLGGEVLAESIKHTFSTATN